MSAWKFREPKELFRKCCEICGKSNNIQKLGTREYRLGLKHEVFVLRHQDVQCAYCGFVYSLFVPEQSFLRDLYRQFYNPHFDYTDIAESYDVEFRRQTIAAHLAPGDKILEIGALDGYMAKPLQRDGYIYDAIDPSTNKKDIAGHNHFILGGCPKGIKYEAISNYYVLEHVAFLRPWLEEIISILNPKGLLITEVPNLLKHPRASLSSLHFSHFTPFHLTNLFEDMGFNILSLTTNRASRNYGMCCVARLEDNAINAKKQTIKSSHPKELYRQVREVFAAEERCKLEEQKRLEDMVNAVIGEVKKNISNIYLWPANSKSTTIGNIIKSQYPHIKCKVVDDSPTREGLYQDDFPEGIISPKSIAADNSTKAFMLCSDNWNNAIFQRMKNMNLTVNPIFDCSSGQRLA